MGKDAKRNEKLIQAREQRNWTQEVVAGKIGISRVAYAHWEEQGIIPRLWSIGRACEVFNMSPEQLGFREYVSKTKFDTSTDSEEDNALAQQAESNEDMDTRKRKTMQGLTAIVGTALVAPKDLLKPQPWSQFSTAVNEQSGSKEGRGVSEDSLGLFGDLTKTCLHLSKGNELEVVEKILGAYLPKVEMLVKQPPSDKQRQAAAIASQGYQLQSMLVGHQLNFPAREAYGQSAVHYGNVSKDPNIYVAALTKLATTFYYQRQWSKALQIYQEAFQYVDAISPLLRSRLYVQAAATVVHWERGEDAKRYITVAYENFPQNAEGDAAFLYADYGRPSLSLWAGITWLNLDNPNEAWKTFAQVGGLLPSLVVSERNRVEILNHQAETAIALNDQELFKAYTIEGLKGARGLRSEKRRQEVWDVYDLAKRTWRNDKGILTLRKDLLDIETASL